jgi:hypothetical protein
MKNLLLLPILPLFGLVAGCSSGATSSSGLDTDLATIRSGYNECVADLGADSPQCKALADGVHQIAGQVGSGQSTAGAMKAEDAARHSMGY